MNYHITNEFQRNQAILDLNALDLTKEWAMTLKLYKHSRSLDQNALMHTWFALIAATEREYTAAQVKGYCKLHFGVPILRGDADFCGVYDKIIKPLTYEAKIMLMSHPDLMPITSLMKTDQLSLMLEEMQQHYAGRVDLRFPE